MSEEVNKITEGINKIKDQIDDRLEVAKKELGEEFKKNLKGEIANELKGLEKMQEQLDALEGKTEKAFSMEQNKPKSFTQELGEILKADEQIKAFKEGQTKMATIRTKADMTTAGNASGEAAVAFRRGGIIYDPVRPVRVRSLMTAIPTSQTNTVRFVREASFTNSAATRNESAVHAQSEFVLETVDTAIRSVGHRIDLPVEMFEDIAGLPAYINARLPEKLMDEEDDQLLNGNGSAPNLQGLMTASGGTQWDASANSGSMWDQIDGAQKYDVLVSAINQVYLANYFADSILVTPSDYHNMLLLKDTTAAYLRDPQTGLLTVLGVPVYKSTAVTADKFLVGNFSSGAYIADRKGMTLEFSRENGDNFEKDLITVKASERIALPIERPNAFAWGDFSDAAAILETP